MISDTSPRIKFWPPTELRDSAGFWYRYEPVEYVAKEFAIDLTVNWTPWLYRQLVPKDKRIIFDLSDNYIDQPDYFEATRFNEFLFKNLQQVELVTCISDELCKRTTELTGAKTVCVKNGIRGPQELDVLEEPEKFTIAWRGTRGWLRALKSVEKYLPPSETVLWSHKKLLKEFPHFQHKSFLGPVHSYMKELNRFQRTIEIIPSFDDYHERAKGTHKLYHAMLAGIPCIVSHLSPFGSEVIDGETALVYKKPEEIPSLIETLRASKSLRRRIGLNAREWVIKNRTIEQMVINFLKAWGVLR